MSLHRITLKNSADLDGFRRAVRWLMAEELAPQHLREVVGREGAVGDECLDGPGHPLVQRLSPPLDQAVGVEEQRRTRRKDDVALGAVQLGEQLVRHVVLDRRELHPDAALAAPGAVAEQVGDTRSPLVAGLALA